MNETIVCTNEQDIRKIEDIIDIQKAKGSIGVKQVAFNLPLEAASTVSVSFAHSLELPKVDGSDASTTKKKKRLQSKRQKSPCPDLSWPSGSDVTVLRLKLNLDTDKVKENIASITPGDGLHLPDSSSMVNLATLLQPPSSCLECVNLEEYLLPLSSWEHGTEYNKDFSDELKTCRGPIVSQADGLATCSRHDELEDLEREVETTFTGNKKSKFTKLMMYFCSCCSWPINEEKIRETPYMNTSNEEVSDR